MSIRSVGTLSAIHLNADVSDDLVPGSDSRALLSAV